MVCAFAIICSMACGIARGFIYGIVYKFAYDLCGNLNDVVHGIVRCIFRSVAHLLSTVWISALLNMANAVIVNIVLTMDMYAPSGRFAALKPFTLKVRNISAQN